MENLRHLLDSGQYFTHGLSSVSIPDMSAVWVMAYPYGIKTDPYVTSILASNLTQECMHKPFLRLPRNTPKRGY